MSANHEYRVIYSNGELSCSLWDRGTAYLFAGYFKASGIYPVALITIKYKNGYERNITNTKTTSYAEA